ncbi:hypothetical protein BC829DRAFT_388689, partial [Chytridium lagenaria]
VLDGLGDGEGEGFLAYADYLVRWMRFCKRIWGEINININRSLLFAPMTMMTNLSPPRIRPLSQNRMTRTPDRKEVDLGLPSLTRSLPAAFPSSLRVQSHHPIQSIQVAKSPKRSLPTNHPLNRSSRIPMPFRCSQHPQKRRPSLKPGQHERHSATVTSFYPD